MIKRKVASTKARIEKTSSSTITALNFVWKQSNGEAQQKIYSQ